MITDSLINFFFEFTGPLLTVFSLFPIEYTDLTPIFSIIKFGNWVVGSDMLITFASMVYFWWTVRLSLNLILWLYEHIPAIGAGG